MSHDLLGAYALDAVSFAERTAVEIHLAACDECARELIELRDSLTRMAVSELTPVDPSPEFTAAVFAAVDAAAPVAVRPRLSGVRGELSRLRAYLGGAGFRRFALGAAAAVVLAASVGVVLQTRVNAERDRADRIAAVIAAPDARLVSSPAAGGGTVSIAYSAARGQAVVTASDLAGIDADRAYQLWLIKDGTPTSVGLLASGAADGVRLIDDVTGAQTLGVTNEPAGGSKAPTLPLVATVPLA
ncbi:anti-sigma factor [Luedemannella flava]|uniref:Regulator of SigK n=1 Tax=Luedemannella flava TaxID=349316 RepID=A0ABP4Z765_9ACTN